MNEKEFDKYVIEVKNYRDKFLAHLDEDPVMHIPLVDNMKNSTSLIYSILLGKYISYLYDAPMDIDVFFHERFEHAKSIYSSRL